MKIQNEKAVKHCSRRQFLIGSTATALGGGLALASCTASGKESSSQSTSEEASVCAVGSGVGKHGHFSVEVAIKDDFIERITVLDSRETQGIGDTSMAKMTKLIIDNQTLNVDTVTGATISGMAFLTAVSEALDKCGLDSEQWKKRDKAEYQPDTQIASSYDVVVVGTGGAGFASAITAAKAEKTTLLVEKMGIYGGSTALSGGGMAAPGNWIQKTEGIEDSIDSLIEDMLVGGDNVGDPELVRVIAEGALDASEWLTFEVGSGWEHKLMHFGGHSTIRSLLPAGESGSEMTVKLTKRALELPNLSLIDCTQATDLIVEGEKVTGVKLNNTITNKETLVSCKALVLASGGFGSNVEMRKKYNAAYGEQFLSTDAVGATGDAITMTEKIGAQLVDLEYIQTYPTCDQDSGALLYVGDMRLEYRAIMINKEGKRFVEELNRRDVLSEAIIAQTDSCAYMLFTQKEADETRLLITHADEYESLEARGRIVRADSLEEACNHFGIDSQALTETVEKWNQYCAQGEDPEFKYRGEFYPIEEGPYYIMSYVPAVHYTMGGLLISPQAEVLNTEGKAISGLYACGEVAGHKMGTNRLGSCAIADIFVFGRIAGAQAASYAS